MKRVGYTILFYAAMACGLAHAETLDIVILANGGLSSGMGYSDSAQFHQDAKAVQDYLTSKEPFASRLDDLTFHQVWQTSSLDCKRSTGMSRLVTCNQSRAGEAVRAMGLPVEKGIILVNTTSYGGSGGSPFAVAYRGSQMKQVALHEFGHSLGLVDEYNLYATSGAVADQWYGQCWKGSQNPNVTGQPLDRWVKGCYRPNYWRQQVLKPTGAWTNSIMHSLSYPTYGPKALEILHAAITRWSP